MNEYFFSFLVPVPKWFSYKRSLANQYLILFSCTVFI